MSKRRDALKLGLAAAGVGLVSKVPNSEAIETTVDMTEVDVQKEIELLYEDWMTAATVHDDDWYKNNLADEFYYFSAGGGKATREEIIDIANLSGSSEYKLYEVTSRLYGEVVLSHGRYMGKGDFPADDPLVSPGMREKYGRGVELRFTGTWIKRDGRWQSLHLQTCEIG